MFEKIVERLLNRILGEYVEDFNSNNLNIGLWKGEVHLKDVRLKNDTMKKLNLPFKLRYSKLRSLTMNIPWSKLASSKIQVLIEGLEVVVSEVHPQEWQLKNEKIIKLRKEQIKGYCQSILDDFAQKAQRQQAQAKGEEEEGYFSSLVVKIIDNLQVQIKDIHIRYEDQITNEYSFGATLEELKVFTVNQDDQPVFIDRTKRQFKDQPLRKRLILSNFGIYWNEKSNFFGESQMGQQLKNTIARKENPTPQHMHYIILMSVQARLLQREKGQQFKDPQIDFFLDFDQLKLEVSNKQLQQIVNMGERLQTFSSQVKRKNRAMLSKAEVVKNVQRFSELFPKFYKNEEGMGAGEMNQLQDILEQMEVEHFKPVIKKFLQVKQKERIMKEKKDKSRGWFTGPKELTEEQKKEIQDFLDQNFGQEVKQVTRPKDYFYIRVNLRLKLLEIVISNSRNNMQEGIRTRLQQIGTQFKLRENGYLLDFGINDIAVEIFQRAKGFAEEKKDFLKKLVTQGENRVQQYVRLTVEGSPIDKPYADTYIKLLTEELLIMFNPKIINIAVNFAQIKINPQNSSAALEKYGQIKEKTTKTVNQSLESTKKSFIYLDVRLKAITGLLYLDPATPRELWAVSLGETRMYTDKDTLKKTEVKPNEPTEKYSLELNDISFRYYSSQEIFLEKKTTLSLSGTSNRREDVLSNLNIDVTLSMYRESTNEIPKIEVQAEMNRLQATLTPFTYSRLQKVGECFADKETDELKVQQRSQEKSEVIAHAKKIGFVWVEENSVTKNWKKYVGILSDNYLYLYKDKRDLNYVAYYYVRNSTIEVVQNPDPQGKQHVIHLKNKVNAGDFGFDRKNLMEDWIQALNNCRDQTEDLVSNLLELNKKESSGQGKQQKKDQITEKSREQIKEEEKKIGSAKLDPNLLNFVLGLKINAIQLTTYLTDKTEGNEESSEENGVMKKQRDIVSISLSNLKMKIWLHQKKTVIGLSLLSIDLEDNIRSYKMSSLRKFLFTERLSEEDKLVDIRISQLQASHPAYNHADNEIFVSFGRLVCNYKAETVSAVMKFFLPGGESSKSYEKEQTEKEEEGGDILASKVNLMGAIMGERIQKFSLKVHLKIAQIAVRLINSKTKIFFAEISMENFQMMFGLSEIRTVLTGGLEQLSLKDYSRYPQTIVEEQAEYSQFNYILTSEKRKRQLQENENEVPHLIFFDINLLNKPNQQNKKMIILTQINDLETSYVQQPVLRLITYLNTQMLPSLTPDQPGQTGPSEKLSAVQKKKAAQEREKAMREKDKINSQKPQLSPMELSVRINNISVLIEPRNELKQSLKLNIRDITVRNESLERPFLKETTEKVLVENYTIALTDMSIFVNYFHPKKKERRTYKLTPDIDFRLSVDLIQNPLYYEKTFKNRFMDGMRIDTWMSDFFMRINHEDYNFLMKCLAWNVTYDDNAQPYLFDPPEQSPEEKQREIPPLYLDLKIQSISLFVIQEELPLAFMLLNFLELHFQKTGNNSMYIKFAVENLIGSSISHHSNGKSVQKGMFNSFAYQRTFRTEELRDLDRLLEKFQRKSQLQQKRNQKPMMLLEMEVDADSNTFIGLKIEQLKIAVEMKTLLLLSQLALPEEHIKPPESSIQPIISEEEKKLKQKQEKEAKETKKITTGRTQIFVELKDFLASLTDSEKRNFLILEGQVIAKLIMCSVPEDKEIAKMGRKAKQQRFLQHSNNLFQLKKFSMYFCSVEDMTHKRYILKPFSVVAGMKKFYEKVRNEETKQQVIVLLTEGDGIVDKLIFEASIRDLLRINEIVQQNLGNLNQIQSSQEPQAQKVVQKAQKTKEIIEQKKQQTEEELLKKEKGKKSEGATDSQKELESQLEKQLEQEQQMVERTRTQIQKPILNKVKAKLKLNPLSLVVINDTERNFMPVIKFILQETTPTFESDLVHAHLSLALTLSLSFFNPRSSKWQPVIENYGATLDYLSLIGQKRNKTQIIVANSPVKELQELKLNVSTQFLASLKTTFQSSREEQKIIQKSIRPSKTSKDSIAQEELKKVKNQEIQIEKKLGGEEVEVSPFIFENITNRSISISRRILTEESQYVLHPMFKGTVRLNDQADSLHFKIGQKRFKISLEHYGVILIPDSPFYIEFKVKKLNRVIRFLSDTVLQNELSHTVYVRRYFKNGQTDKDGVELNKKDMVALDGVSDFQISLNKRSYSVKESIKLVRELPAYQIKAQNKKFLLWLTRKSLSNHFTMLELWPPLLMYNCLPKEFTVQFIVNDKVHTKDIEAQEAHEVNANLDFYQLRFKINVPGFYWSPEFQMQEYLMGKEMNLQLRDRENGTTTINYTFNKTERGYTLIIFCKAFLISELEDDILAYGNLAVDQSEKNRESYHVLGGQRAKSAQHDDDIIIIGSEYGSKLRVCGDGCMIDFSQPFSLGGVGMTQNRRIVVKRKYQEKEVQMFTTIGIDVSVRQMFKDLKIFSKMVVIHSRSIIINNTKQSFRIREEGSTQEIFRIQPGEKKNFFFNLPENPTHPRGIIFTPENCSSSHAVNISELGTMYFKVDHRRTHERNFYKLFIQEVSKYIFYEISALQPEKIPYQIENRLPKAKVILKSNNITLLEGEKHAFIKQQQTAQEHRLKVRITHEHARQPKDITICPDDLNFRQIGEFDLEIGAMKASVKFEVRVNFNDNRKLIVIDSVAEHRKHIEEEEEEVETSTINLRLERITFSFIQNHISIERPFESFCLLLSGLEFVNIETNRQSKYQLKLGYLQLDQNEPFNMPNPVILTPYRMKEFLREESPKAIFNSYININKHFTQNTFINRVQIEFNDLVLKISHYFVDLVLRISKEFTEVINYQQQDYRVVRKVDQWAQIQVPKEGHKTYIKHIRIPRFILQVSAEIKLDKLDTESFLFFGTILNALGVVITNIEGAPIQFDGVDLEDCVDTMAGINQKLINHYKTSVIRQFYKIFGSLNIIGNPIGLFRNISTGFRDLKDKPSEGFVQGPLQFGKGIAQGTSSLIAHSVGGALNSVSKVTGTISSGLAVLAFDKEFQELREKQKMQKPQHIFQGIEKGGKAVFYGFREGIKGVFLQPYENTKREGVLGLFKGTAKGLAGLVVKPVTGVIDFASKTTEGLKNTALYLEDKPNENRMRYPRVFYTECSTIKDYDQIDSKLNAIINKLKYEKQFHTSFFIESFLCDDERYLLLLQDKLMMIRLEEEKVSWVIDISKLKLSHDPDRKELRVIDDVKHTFRKSEHIVKISDKDSREKIVSLIDIINKEYEKNHEWE